MRHRDDDLSPFRDDPVVKALTGPATEAELADEPQALEAFRAAVPQRRRRRPAARIASTTTAAVLVVAVSGGAAAAYTSNLPDSWQQKLHTELHVIGVPAPHHHKSAPPSPAPVVAAPTESLPPTPAPARTGVVTPTPRSTPSSVPSSVPPSPRVSSTLPVTVPTPSATPTPTPTPSTTPSPASGAQLTMAVSPGTRVTVGTPLTVSGTLKAAGGTAVANRWVALAERVVGQPGWHRVGAVRTNADGAVTISAPAVQRNVRLLLRSRGHVRSPVTKVVVIPLIHLEVAPASAGARTTTVTMTVSGAEAGDVVAVRNRAGNRQMRLDASLTATFTVPASQFRTLHYRAVVLRTKAHAAHALPFYVPPSGTATGT
ncbi:MAG TPA: hypothetical protein VG650_15385 [Mycobacteriales bacterium]|nr:hypothetical protein [Mycobacteriales bacterium]